MVAIHILIYILSSTLKSHDESKIRYTLEQLCNQLARRYYTQASKLYCKEDRIWLQKTKAYYTICGLDSTWTYSIKSIHSYRGGAKAVIAWKKGETTIEGKRFFIKNRNKWELATELTFFTRDWKTIKNNNISLHYPPELALPNSTIAQIDSIYKQIIAKLGLKSSPKIDYFWFNDEIADTVFGLNGLSSCFTSGSRVVCYQLSDHEITHAITFAACRDSIVAPRPFITEGTASFLEASCNQVRLPFAQKWLKDHPDFSLDSLLDPTWFFEGIPSTISYSIASSFVAYLMSLNREVFMDFFSSSISPWQDIDQALIKCYNMDFAVAAKGWKLWLFSQRFETVEAHFGKNAKQILNIDDPIDDDRGTGSFLYPEDYEPGWLDITKFSIYADTARLYFSIEMKNLAPPESSLVILDILGWPTDDSVMVHPWAYVNIVGGYARRIAICGNVLLINTGPLKDRPMGMLALCYLPNEVYNFKENQIKFSIPLILLDKIGMGNQWCLFLGVPMGKTAKERWLPWAYALPVTDTTQVVSTEALHFVPRVYDLVLPTGFNQQEVLREYAQNRLARVPMIKAEP